MGNTRNTGYLQNTIKVSDAGAISFMSGSTMLATINTTGQMSGSAPVLFASTASFVALAQTASFVALAQTSSFVANAQTASFVANAQSASNAVAAQTASFANAFTVAGNLTAQTLVVQTITSSVDFVTGSTRFGSIIGNTHVFTGSMAVSGGLVVSSTTPELTVSATGVTLGNVIGDAHSITGSVSVSGSATFASSINVGTTTNAGVILTTSSTSGFSFLDLVNSGASGKNYQIGIGGNSAAGNYANNLYIDLVGVRNIMMITSAGNVGIGTSSPSSPLSFANTTGNKIDLYNDGTARYSIQINGGEMRLYTSQTDDVISLYAGNVIGLVNKNGNVGIGTSSPSSLLHLQSSASGGQNLRIQTSIAAGRNYVQFANGSGDMGYFGYGGANSNFFIVNQLNADMLFYTNDAERMRITSGGNVGIGITPSSWATITPIQIKNASFAGYSTGTTHILYAGSNFYYDGSGDKYISNGHASLFSQALGEHNWSSGPNNSSGAGASLTLTANMKLSQPGDLYLYNGSIQQQGVWTVFNTGITTGDSAFTFDVGVDNEGGGGNIFKVEAAFAHFSGMAYNCLAEFYISTRGTGSEITDVIRRDTALAGSFTAFKTTSTLLRISKSAGSYGGGGRYWIKVTKVNY